MKKLVFVLTLFIAYNGFSQTVTVEKLMSLNGSADIFERLINSSIQNVAPEHQADFRNKAETLATNKKLEAQKYFQKKYSQKEIEEIYNELNQSERLSYSEKTNSFIKEWRSYKAEYQAAFKDLFGSYQN